MLPDRKRPRFDPTSLGLPEDFVLTDYTRLKGCSCKLPQAKLLSLLAEIATTPGKKDVGMDCSIVPIHHKNQSNETLFLVSTTDYFFPSVDDPYAQGQIGAANVLSDLYSMGIPDCDTILMLLAASTDMDEHERDIVTREIMKGFVDHVNLAECHVTGGQTVMNPWPLIGGVAMRVVSEKEMIRPAGLLCEGDVLVLTKPLGCQIAVNLKQWTRRPSQLYKDKIQGQMEEEEIEVLYQDAVENMKRLNRTASRLMHKYEAHGATDITGFGILGHARNFGAAQAESDSKKELILEINLLPILKGAVKASKLIHDKYRLFEGFSAETSGGLLVALRDVATANEFINEIQKIDKKPAWLIGKVLRREPESNLPYARLADDYKIVEV